MFPKHTYKWLVCLPDTKTKLVASVCYVVPELSEGHLVGTDGAGTGGTRGKVIKVIPVVSACVHVCTCVRYQAEYLATPHTIVTSHSDMDTSLSESTHCSMNMCPDPMYLPATALVHTALKKL